jgi:hypothetical protein
MIGQTYEKLHDVNESLNWYQKALTFTTHNPPVAYARPLAKRKLGP